MNTYNLEELAQSTTKMERVIAGGHIDISLKTLKRLVHDSELEVREVATRNLQRLVAEPISLKTLEWLASANIPNEVLNWLKIHPDPRVGLMVFCKYTKILNNANWNE
jgi:hypothetical protein